MVRNPLNRIADFFRGSWAAADWSAIIFCLAIALTTATTVSILFSKTMAVAALKRFHLASESYPIWALHQCAPSMYNFENKVWFANSRGPEISPGDRGFYSATVNHFPARHITYGDLRSRQFLDQDLATFKMTSSFQGETLVSVWQIEKKASGVWKIKRVVQKLDLDEESE
jgi:uncharacterized membrane protein YcjF (UPF0283 family)